MSEYNQFFSDVTEGDARYQPRRSWRPMIPVPSNVQEVFKEFEGSFEKHIATSIPLYRELQLKQVQALLETFPQYEGKTRLLYDIAGSEGSWIKTLCELGWNFAINVDCNASMRSWFNIRTPNQGVAIFTHNSFLQDTEGIKAFVPPAKADVVHAGMAFQFMPFSRHACITEVKMNYLKSQGLFLIEEKVVQEQEADFNANEALKDLFKSLYYTEKQLALKSEVVLNNLNAKLYSEDMLVDVLKKGFHYVRKYYEAGNFVGYACSDYGYIVNNFCDKLGKIQL